MAVMGGAMVSPAELPLLHPAIDPAIDPATDRATAVSKQLWSSARVTLAV
jgi:hypothetical protein